ncbi:ERC protein 2 CAZ-associated structural protein 1 [Takifugu flavidus]|uniref:ERC protein 2 CAZ-associated structural protein 1 n=1 Tax=Takifugu flavidus TaxID=433684 RepID=A0A5C6MTE2_9TELE|nr:ERC protein 2 CAZ-associated structural protein 1 [Takifugu flavidus]
MSAVVQLRCTAWPYIWNTEKIHQWYLLPPSLDPSFIGFLAPDVTSARSISRLQSDEQSERTQAEGRKGKRNEERGKQSGQQALLAAISEKDANIALLELSSSKRKKAQEEVMALKREKDRLMHQLKQQTQSRMKLMADNYEEDHAHPQHHPHHSHHLHPANVHPRILPRGPSQANHRSPMEALHSPALVISEPQPGGQQRRLTEAVPQPAISILSLWGQRLFHQAAEIWKKSAPER